MLESRPCLRKTQTNGRPCRRTCQCKFCTGHEANNRQTRAPQTSNYRGGSHAARGGRPGAPPPQQQQKNFSLPPDREPPVGYICYRCGNKGESLSYVAVANNQVIGFKTAQPMRTLLRRIASASFVSLVFLGASCKRPLRPKLEKDHLLVSC
jgi:hypothetical protein